MNSATMGDTFLSRALEQHREQTASFFLVQRAPECVIRNMDCVLQKLRGLVRKRTDDQEKKSKVLEQWMLFVNQQEQLISAALR